MAKAHDPRKPHSTPIHAWPWLVLLLGIGLGTTPAHAATTVFRSVDAEGRVVFSDTPPVTGTPAEPIVVQDPSTFPSVPPTRDNATWELAPDGTDDESGEYAAYARLEITTPAADETVRENDGNVSVVATVEPELRPGHWIELLLNGVVVADATAPGFLLENIERGTHTLSMRIVDDSGTVRIESAPVTFHLQRYAPLLAPNRPRPTPLPRGN